MPLPIQFPAGLLKADMACLLLCALIVLAGAVGFFNQRAFLLSVLHPFSVSRGSGLYRLLSSGFFHNNIRELVLNLAMLIIFGFPLEVQLTAHTPYGHLEFAAIFLFSMLAGNVILAGLHRQDFLYTCTGSSGGVLAVMVSYLLFNPGHTPVYVPFAGAVSNLAILLIYLAGTIYLAVKRKQDGISHELHLLGCLGGIAITLLLNPYLISRL